MDIVGTKAKYFYGLARIELRHLDFRNALRQNHREETSKAISRLLRVFNLEGCRRYEEENFLDVMINPEVLDNGLQQAGLSRETLRSATVEHMSHPAKIPRLNLTSGALVDCLTGLHRIAAAKEYLDRNDRWWIVRLYSTGTSARD